ncbi:ABC transporter permease [Labedaea rhizosphaerae]|uniref:Monosaccharide ABC transporter membrane protein (CUT2 family) n=1 Tax=Labedaea rhizosphaerae TaxID=598644 RepID=A0A4R6SFU9_LABRH|nr:ABC transporter permease [Labedaea rhizosphaerae]TDQ00387.1 monosaccharide ABC transporter membrane protein (CUT2 family) [Labedaea rhizosphaerae]
MRGLFASSPALGPFAALVVAVVFFSVATDTFFNLDNFSFVVQQSVVIGTLALGQTLIILTAGIDLANAAIAVFGTVLVTRLALGGMPSPVALVLGIVGCTLVAALSGGLVTRLKLPPFIVTLGMLAVMTAVTSLYSQGTTWPVPDGLLTVLGTQLYLFGQIQMTIGMGVALVLFVVVWVMLARTAWGRHVYAVGDDKEAARLSGINIDRTLLSVYALAGLVYGIAAWLAMGRTPTADPNAYQTGNLDSITAVVIGGTSLFGGRGGVAGTVVGALIVAVLRSGLTQMEIDSNYQNLATGVLVIAAVAFDQITRRRSA